MMADMKEVYDNLIIKAHKTCFVCQSISILFIVLGMYNFDLNLLLHSAHCLFASCIYSGSSRAGPCKSHSGIIYINSTQTKENILIRSKYYKGQF